MFYPGCYPEYNQWKKIYNILESLTVEKKYTGYNEYTLKEIASSTGGHYYQFNSTNNAIKYLMSDLERLDKDKLESQFETHQVERFQIFLLVAFIALVLTELIPDGSMKLVHRWNVRS